MKLEKYTFGCGDRFGREAAAQLAAYEKMAAAGVEVIPVWNKSDREHRIIGSEPPSVREAAAAAAAAAGWTRGFHVDADHINSDTVAPYIESSDFFTIDVARSIDGAVSAGDVDDFLKTREALIDKPLDIPGLGEPMRISGDGAREAARRYLPAVQSAAAVYRRIRDARGEGGFITEISIDETAVPQGPRELLLILAAAADAGIPVQTIAPRFSGRFNKGVDYIGDVGTFAGEFETDLAVIAYAARRFGLPRDLKLSVHSGSDKFALYPEIGRLIRRHDAGVHVKTAGTTWLEEIIGLAESGGSGLKTAKTVYERAFERREDLCAPYAEVIDIDENRLPAPAAVNTWDSRTFTRSLRHEVSDELYNPSFRQLIHVGYKIAAEMGPKFFDVLDEHREAAAKNVTANLYERHMKRLFLP